MKFQSLLFFAVAMLLTLGSRAWPQGCSTCTLEIGPGAEASVVLPGQSFEWVFTLQVPPGSQDNHSYLFLSLDCAGHFPQAVTSDNFHYGPNGGTFEWFSGVNAPQPVWKATQAFDRDTTCTFSVFRKDTAQNLVRSADIVFVQTPQSNLGPTSTTAGEPIDLTTGNTYIQQTDISVPGRNGGLQLVRTWNSLFTNYHGPAVANGLFGNNWRSNYEEHIETVDGGIAHYWRGDGSVWVLSNNPSGSLSHYTMMTPANNSTTLDQGAQYWTMTFANGERRLFNSIGGALVAIQDRNGNTTTLTYDSVGRLLTVTDPSLRHLYFHYGMADSFDDQFNTTVTSVTSDFGPSVAYQYTNQIGFDVTNFVLLANVTYPDQSGFSFGYEFDADFSTALISAVTDAAGKVLQTHTYDDQDRGLTSSKANGVESLTVTYPQQ